MICQNDATDAALGLLGLHSPSPSSSIPTKRKQPPADTDNTTAEAIDCICGISVDDGFSIGCDSCSRWCHAACFNVIENEVPDEWHCWICAPRPVDKDRAHKLQLHKARQRSALHRRRQSPGVERRSRKHTATAPEQKRKRRPSIAVPHTEDEHVDIDEPWTQSFVPITQDIVATDDARERLRRLASDWRGVSAIGSTPGCPTPVPFNDVSIEPQIILQPVSNSAASFPSMFANGNVSVRPPSYALHAAQPIPSSKLIAPYPSTIIPTATYLRDPLNAYAHLGMPKPYVHLFGPPLDVALDARITGDHSRFVRNGCRPNAILRPMFCQSQREENDDIRFGIFALRDLKANEEVVLGWEWDDGNVVHHLPALIQSPFVFPPHQMQHLRNQMNSMLHTLASTFTTCACGATARDCVLTRIAVFLENHTPPAPSPSPPSQFSKGKIAVQGHESPDETVVDLGPLVGLERGFRTRERIPSSGGIGGVELVSPEPGPSRIFTQPAGKRSHDAFLVPPQSTHKGKDRKGKARADDSDHEGPMRPLSEASPDRMEVDGPPSEQRLPPKLRKAWIAKNAEQLRVRQHSDRELGAQMPVVGVGGDKMADGLNEKPYFDSPDMPPPSALPSRTPPLLPPSTSFSYLPPLPISAATSSSSTASSFSSKPQLAFDTPASPSLPFSKLSLLSPVFPPPSALTSRTDAVVSEVKRRRPTTSPQPSPDSHKPTKGLKSKSKAKEKERERDGVNLKEKGKGKGKIATRKIVPPNTHTDDQNNTPLTPSHLRREEVVKGARAAQLGEASTSSASVPPPTPSAPSTPFIIPPELPPELPDEELGARNQSDAKCPSAKDQDVDHDKMEVDCESMPDAVLADSIAASVPNVRTAAAAPSSTLFVSISRPDSLLFGNAVSANEDTISSSGLTQDVQHRQLPSVHTVNGPLTDEPLPGPLSPVSVPHTVKSQPQPPAVNLEIATDGVRDDSEPLAVKTAASQDASAMAWITLTPEGRPACTPTPASHGLADVTSQASQLESVPLLSPQPESSPAPAPPFEPHVDAQPNDDHDSEHLQVAPAPAKVKLSLKDFALRKKKQREELELIERKKEVLPAVPRDSPLGGPSSELEAGEGAGVYEGEGLRLGGVARGTSADEDGDVRMVEEKGRESEGRAGSELKIVDDTHAEVSERVQEVDAPSGVEILADVSRLSNNDRQAESPLGDSFGRHTEAPLHGRRHHLPSPGDAFDKRNDATDSPQAKIELVDTFVPNGLVIPARDVSPNEPQIEIHSMQRATPTTPRLSPKMANVRVLHTTHPSHEDGEIFSPPPPKPPPLAPRSHSPPTHPRSFFAGGSVSPTRWSPPLSSSARRPLAMQYARPRAVPSAPRALRDQRSPYGSRGGTHMGNAPPYLAPRGPSADRERERDRERSKDWLLRERGDAERSWTPGPLRGRGRGSWGR